MKKLVIEEEYKTPAIDFDGYKGTLEINGNSLPDKVSDFYDPLMAWIESYCKLPASSTVLNLRLEYCNSFSRKYILEMIKTLKKLKDNGHDLTINWYFEYDDLELKEEGEIFSKLADTPINLIDFKPNK